MIRNEACRGDVLRTILEKIVLVLSIVGGVVSLHNNGSIRPANDVGNLIVDGLIGWII